MVYLLSISWIFHCLPATTPQSMFAIHTERFCSIFRDQVALRFETLLISASLSIFCHWSASSKILFPWAIQPALDSDSATQHPASSNLISLHSMNTGHLQPCLCRQPHHASNTTRSRSGGWSEVNFCKYHSCLCQRSSFSFGWKSPLTHLTR